MIPQIIKETARKLRNNMTKSEEILWEHIKDRKLGVRFLRQKPFYLYTENSGLDRYIIPDFFCSSKNMIIEVDGNIHDLEEVLNLDIEKEKLIKQRGIKIIRVTNYEIYSNIDPIINKIKQELNK